MANLVTGDIIWKKGDRGLQTFNIYESDNITPRNGTGKTYTFKFWDETADPPSLVGSGTLSAVTAASGIYTYAVTADDTSEVDNYVGELIEDAGTSNELKTDTFKVTVKRSSSGLT